MTTKSKQKIKYNQAFFETMDHFVNEGWTIYISTKDAKELKGNPYFELKRTKDYSDRPWQVTQKKEFSSKLLARYWQKKYEEECEYSSKLYNEISKVMYTIENL